MEKTLHYKQYDDIQPIFSSIEIIRIINIICWNKWIDLLFHTIQRYIFGFVQECCYSSPNTLALLQPCVKPLICNPDSQVPGANMGSTWVLSAPDGPHVGPRNLVIRDLTHSNLNDGCPFRWVLRDAGSVDVLLKHRPVVVHIQDVDSDVSSTRSRFWSQMLLCHHLKL